MIRRSPPIMCSCRAKRSRYAHRLFAIVEIAHNCSRALAERRELLHSLSCERGLVAVRYGLAHAQVAARITLGVVMHSTTSAATLLRETSPGDLIVCLVAFVAKRPTLNTPFPL